MRKADILPPSCAVVMKSGNLNFLEPSGPLQACNGAALPFMFIFHFYEEIQQDATVCRYLFAAKLLYMFRASIAPIIRST